MPLCRTVFSSANSIQNRIVNSALLFDVCKFWLHNRLSETDVTMRINISLLRVNMLILTLVLSGVLLLGCGNEQPPSTTAFTTSTVSTRVGITTPTTMPKSVTPTSTVFLHEAVGLSICLLILIMIFSSLIFGKKSKNLIKLVKKRKFVRDGER
jgi:hypothetical protein